MSESVGELELERSVVSLLPLHQSTATALLPEAKGCKSCQMPSLCPQTDKPIM